jgi:hypothetical protein
MERMILNKVPELIFEIEKDLPALLPVPLILPITTLIPPTIPHTIVITEVTIEEEHNIEIIE